MTYATNIEAELDDIDHKPQDLNLEYRFLQIAENFKFNKKTNIKNLKNHESLPKQKEKMNEIKK